MPRYLLKTPLKTLEGTVPAGATVELAEKDGAALVACKAAEKVRAAQPAASSGTAPAAEGPASEPSAAAPAEPGDPAHPAPPEAPKPAKGKGKKG